MRKSYDAILLRDIVITVTMSDMNGYLSTQTDMPLRAGRFAFRTARKRDEWVEAINCQHPGAARVAHV